MRRAFVVGCAKFSSDAIVDLPFAENDARLFFELMTDPLLGDADPSTSELVLSPTRNALSVHLGAFIRSLGPDDEFIIYLAGHGTHLKSGRLAFDCHDTVPEQRALTAFGERDLVAQLRARRGVRGTIILDTCHAGSFAVLQRDTRARGDVEQISLDPAQEGITVLWACGSREQAFERDGAGMFSALLCKAIRLGAATSPHASVVRAADILDWIRAQLRKTTLAEQFWPGLRSHGDVGALFLSRNPNFNSALPQERSDSGPQFMEELSRLVQRLIGDADLAQHAVEKAADRAARGLPALVGEPYEIERPNLKRFGWAWIKRAFFYPGCLFILFAAITDGTDNSDGLLTLGLLVWALVIGGVTLHLYTVQKEQRVHFLLVTPFGLCLAQGGSLERPNRSILTWDAVHGIERHTETTNGQVMNDRLDFFGARGNISENTVIKTITDSDVALVGGLDRATALIEKFLGMHTAFLLPSVQEVISEEDLDLTGEVNYFALLASGTYKYMPKLSAPEKDVSVIKLALTNARISGNEAKTVHTLQEFEYWLIEFLDRMSGKIAVLYFSGHGIPVDGELVLALGDTEPTRALETGFPLSKLGDAVADRRLKHLILVLDCCFSGQAGGNLGYSLISERALRDVFEMDEHAISILAAASEGQEALALAQKPSVFTDALASEITLQLRTHRGRIMVRTICDAVSVRLNDTGLGQRPWCFLSHASGDIALAKEIRAEKKDLAPAIEEGVVQQIAALRQYVQIANQPVERRRTTSSDVPSLAVFDCAPIPPTGWNSSYGFGCFVILTVLGGLLTVCSVTSPDAVGASKLPTMLSVLLVSTAIAFAVGFAGRKPAVPRRRLVLGLEGLVLVHSVDGQVWSEPQFDRSLSEAAETSTPSFGVPANHISTFRVNRRHVDTNGSVEEKRELVWIDNSGTARLLATNSERWSRDVELIAKAGLQLIAVAKQREIVRLATARSEQRLENG